MSASAPDAHLPRVPYLLTGIVASIVVAIIALASITGDVTASADAMQNQTLAYNVAQYGIFSLDEGDNPQPQPTLHREPLYPLLLAAVLRTFADMDELTHACLIADDACAPQRLLLNRVSIAFMIALVWVFTAAAYTITRRWWLTWSLLLLFLVDFFLYTITMTELPAALLLTLHSLALYRAVIAWQAGRSPGRAAAVSGLSLGALILVKTIFQYWALLLAAALILLVLWRWNRDRAQWWTLWRSLALFTGGVLLLVTPWLVRNAVQLGELKIAGRDAIVLSVRLEHSFLTAAEYRASFAYFASPVLRRHLLPLFDEADYRRLDRNNTDSFHYMGRNRTGSVAQRVDDMGGARSAATLAIIRERWPQHAALALTFGWRGAFVDGLYGATQAHPATPPGLRPVLLEIAGIVGLTFVPALLGVAGYALWRRRWALLAFLLPAMYSFAIHAAITHYIPRYSAPLVPVFLIALGVVAAGVVGRIMRLRGYKND